MGTKVTIRYRSATDGLPGYHLYHDVMDELVGEHDCTETPVYLSLENVDVEVMARTNTPQTTTLTFKMPRELARELGLVPVAQWKPASAPVLGLPGTPEPP